MIEIKYGVLIEIKYGILIEIKYGVVILNYPRKFIMSYYLAFAQVSLEVLCMNI